MYFIDNLHKRNVKRYFNKTNKGIKYSYIVYLSLLHESLPGLRDLVPLGVYGGRVVGVDGGQAARLAVQRRHLVLQRRQVALHALVLTLHEIYISLLIFLSYKFKHFSTCLHLGVIHCYSHIIY